MQRLEVSGAVRPIYGSLGFKGLTDISPYTRPKFVLFYVESTRNAAIATVSPYTEKSFVRFIVRQYKPNQLYRIQIR